MIKVEHKKDCTGCAACANICPIGCISMIEDNEGFVYPQVNDSECIKCGMCDKACPIKKCKPTNTEVKNTLAYAVVNKDDRVRYNSSSGAVFPLLANYVLEKMELFLELHLMIIIVYVIAELIIKMKLKGFIHQNMFKVILEIAINKQKKTLMRINGFCFPVHHAR